MAKESENQNLDQRIELPGSKIWKKKRKIFLIYEEGKNGL